MNLSLHMVSTMVFDFNAKYQGKTIVIMMAITFTNDVTCYKIACQSVMIKSKLSTITSIVF